MNILIEKSKAELLDCPYSLSSMPRLKCSTSNCMGWVDDVEDDSKGYCLRLHQTIISYSSSDTKVVV